MKRQELLGSSKVLVLFTAPEQGMGDMAGRSVICLLFRFIALRHFQICLQN